MDRLYNRRGKPRRNKITVHTFNKVAKQPKPPPGPDLSKVPLKDLTPEERRSLAEDEWVERQLRWHWSGRGPLCTPLFIRQARNRREDEGDG
jgi:hypothetical protein